MEYYSLLESLLNQNQVKGKFDFILGFLLILRRLKIMDQDQESLWIVLTKLSQRDEMDTKIWIEGLSNNANNR